MPDGFRAISVTPHHIVSHSSYKEEFWSDPTSTPWEVLGHWWQVFGLAHM